MSPLVIWNADRLCGLGMGGRGTKGVDQMTRLMREFFVSALAYRDGLRGVQTSPMPVGRLPRHSIASTSCL